MIVTTFPLGKVLVTPAAEERILDEDIRVAVQKHSAGCWGYVRSRRYQKNDQALLTHGPVHSEWRDRNGNRFTIRTEGDRSETVIDVL